MDNKQIAIIGAGANPSILSSSRSLYDAYPSIMTTPRKRNKTITCTKCQSRDQLRKVNNTYVCRQCLTQK